MTFQYRTTGHAGRLTKQRRRGRLMPLGFERFHPEGMDENSPAFQRWDRGLDSPKSRRDG